MGFLSVLGLFFIVSIVCILIFILFLFAIFSFFGFSFLGNNFLNGSFITLNCASIQNNMSMSMYKYPLSLPLKNPKEWQPDIARSLLEISLAVTASNCPNVILPLPQGFSYMKFLMGKSPITGTETLYGVYFYSQQYKVAMICFSGTATTSDWINDFDYTQVPPTELNNVGGFNTPCLVHKGFYNIYVSIRDQIFKNLEDNMENIGNGGIEQLIVAGHSLGGALSTLCTIDLFNASSFSNNAFNSNLFHYSFASPRVGNREFASICNENPQGQSWRLFNEEDLIPQLPPSVTYDYLYEHTVPAVFFVKNLGTLEKNHTLAYQEYLGFF